MVPSYSVYCFGTAHRTGADFAFRALALSRVVKRAPSVGAGSSERRILGWPLHWQAVTGMLPVDREVIIEIPVQSLMPVSQFGAGEMVSMS